ncbi:hypothetical protein [Streptomyces sp. NBC_00503]|uniref:hypothetical protein n=1 Tax=Streptomyces sp. NBC_00503 TaxID=2903659 RepID=UPI002E817B94|nr:hypothetical protein [Streptomyces sp. NBC_00503]WUD80121.1 hypothetical protein OG490_05855 [Streptomyces sp. NBC_00503]
MWPGQQQPPGGEQNPQDAHQNPYQQQPGTPNPYQQQPPANGEQQPGYGYPQQPPAPQQWGQQQPQTVPVQQWGAPPPAAPQPPGGKSPFATKTVAIVAASAVVVAAVVTGVVVMNHDKGKSDRADDKPTTAPTAPASSGTPAPASSGANPRGGGDVKPVIPGWKVVINPKYGTAFDVPPEWNVLSSGMSVGFSDDVKGDGSPLVMMSAPAFLKEDWCKVDANKDGKEESTSLAGTGSKGGQGAKDLNEAARNEAGNWVFAAYAQKAPKGTVKVTDPKEYTTTSGLKGSMATATVTGLPKENKCSSDGKSIAFSFLTPKGDLSSWILYGAANVPGEVTQETFEKILSTVRISAS